VSLRGKRNPKKKKKKKKKTEKKEVNRDTTVFFSSFTCIPPPEIGFILIKCLDWKIENTIINFLAENWFGRLALHLYLSIRVKLLPKLSFSFGHLFMQTVMALITLEEDMISSIRQRNCMQNVK